MNIRFVAQILVIGFSVFAFTATSYVEERSLWIEEKYPVSLSDVEIEQILKDDSNISFISSDSHDVESNVNYGLDKSNYAIRLIFELRYPICEKDKIRFYTSIVRNRGSETAEIKDTSAYFWCEDEPSRKQYNEVKSAFEQEIVEKIMRKEPK